MGGVWNKNDILSFIEAGAQRGPAAKPAASPASAPKPLKLLNLSLQRPNSADSSAAANQTG